ncbi:uncharacterized protein LOC108108237 [Drosophila eugracilis]|uniref:uncharacterized protein LOC108108237 n=1 Tax=Drosophila eugracilis TaxID=29029 RepID=UPI0007E69E20|nr:uncharacterized protein LOC108108237 [Drosophila eugracilis]
MGGTKCCFRDCAVASARNPRMHFFKFPVKDPKRLKAWVENCANPDVSNASLGKLAGKAVCARHFRAESFMNYKMDRLAPFQTPTLLRINKDLALDFASLDSNGEALLVKLTPPKQQHLVPPKGFQCPLGFVDDDDDETQNVEAIRKKTRVNVDQRVEKSQETQSAKLMDLTEVEDHQPADETNGTLYLLNSEHEHSVLNQEKAVVENQNYTTITSGDSVMPQNILDLISQLQPSMGIKLIKRPVEIQTIIEMDLDLNEQQLPIESTEGNTEEQIETKGPENCYIPASFRETINKQSVPVSPNETRNADRLKMISDIVQKRKMQKEVDFQDDNVLRSDEQSTQEQPKRRKPIEEALKTEIVVQAGQTTIRSKQKSAPCEKPTQSIQSVLNDISLKTASVCFINQEDNLNYTSESEDESAPSEKPSSSEDTLREKLHQDYNKLQAEFDKLSEENAKLKQLQDELLKTHAAPPTKPAANSLTKQQLYMGIKKYLGPTMAALLRMEMFGGSEDRTWKDDEREFATELLQLGDEVYKYCCDEWRFRLPSIRIARSWLEKRKTDDTEDFLDL